MENASHIETEIKLPVADPVAARACLEQHGFAVSTVRVFEANVVYDTEDHSLRQRGELVRIRWIRPSAPEGAGGDSLLTFKSVALPGKHKRREELETRVADGAVLGTILERLGLRPSFRYEKYRTEYRRKGGDGLVTLDETPIGAFLELEGPAAWIDRTARELGFSEDQYVLASYGALYFEYCRTHDLKPGHMVFPPA